MADNLSPLVNLDLINQIYKTINAQITERVYDPAYNSKATLGIPAHPYVSACISNNISTGTLNSLTLTKAAKGFTISGGDTSKKLTIEEDAAIKNSLVVKADTSITGNLTVSAATNIIKDLTVGTTDTGAVTIQSSGAGNTTIEGPSGGTATFKAPTSDVLGSLQIKNNSYISTVSVAHGKTISTRSNLTVGESGNTGDVVIKPKSTYKLTITSNDTNATTAILRNGTCVITDDYAENNTAGKLVKRDSYSNINVTSVNSVGITGGKENSTDKITLSKGNANINVTGASLSVSKNLKVLSVATLGEANTGSVTIKSAGDNGTVIVGPSGGVAAQLVGGKYTTSATTENSTTPTSDKLLKIGTVDAKKFLAGPASSSGIASYRTIVDSDLPEASASASGIVTTGTQTFAGEKTFSETISGSINGNAATLSLAEGDEDFSSFIVFQDAQNNTSKLTAHYATDFKYNPHSNLMDVGSVRLKSKVTFQYNSSTESLDFIFA